MPPRLALLAALAVLVACARTPRIERIEPARTRGGEAFRLVIEGVAFGDAPKVELGDRTVVVERATDSRIEAAVPALPRGDYVVRVRSDRGTSEPSPLAVDNTPPRISAPTPHLVHPGDTLVVPLAVSDFERDSLLVSLKTPIEGVRVSPDRLVVPTAATDEGRRQIVLVVRDGHDESTATVEVDVTDDAPPPELTSVGVVVPGSRKTIVPVSGTHLGSRLKVTLDGAPVPAIVETRTRVAVSLPPRPRGTYALRAVRGAVQSAPLEIEVGNSRPLVAAFSAQIDEHEPVSIPIEATDPDGDTLTTYGIDLWPGARFVAEENRITFTPDFIQGGRTYRGTLAASDGIETGTVAVSVTVRDTVRPPPPRVLSVTREEDHEQIVLSQTTDDFLDRRDRAGRSIEARLVVPLDRAGGRPLRVYLHGFGGRPYRGGRGDLFALYPHDPENTYWWGYTDERGELTGYTARRVLHLVDHVLKTYPEADPERVYVFGTSMGGAGASTLGAVYARHFAFSEGTMGQMIPRRHRPTRLEQLTTLWGAPSERWDDIDVVRLLVESHDAQNQFYLTRHAKDDPVIHFGAVLMKSPRVGLSYYEALQQHAIGHYAVWDEGAHGPPDPELGASWWVDGWEPAMDEVTFLERSLAFPAFTGSSLDDDPGSADGDGTRPFDPDRGYAGELEVAGDQGWGGDRYGAFNRHLVWDARSIEDELDHFTVRLRSKKPVTVSVTPRRVRRFVLRRGERVRWRHGAASGVATTSGDGIVTVEVELGPEWSALELSRSESP